MAHLNAAGITRLVTKLKDRFAALAHTHAAATDITGQLPVANGGTGASTASGARANLDAAQDNSSGITLADAGSNISTLLATTGIASTPSGSTLQGQIDTLQHSVSYSTVELNTGTYAYDNRKMRLEKYGRICVLHVSDIIVPHGGYVTVATVPNEYTPTFSAQIDTREPGSSGRNFRIVVATDKSVKVYNYGTTDTVMNGTTILVWIAAN